MVGMTVAAIVAGNTVVLKPAEHRRARSPRSSSSCWRRPGCRRAWSTSSPARAARWATRWSITRRRASSRSPARARSACASTSAPRSCSRARAGSSARSWRWAARTRIVVDETPTSTPPPTARRLGLRLPGPEVLGLLARDRRRGGLRRGRGEGGRARAQIDGRRPRRISANYMGAGGRRERRTRRFRTTSRSARRGHAAARRRGAQRERLLHPADDHRRRRADARIAQEEIFGPVLAVIRRRTSTTRWRSPTTPSTA